MRSISYDGAKLHEAKSFANFKNILSTTSEDETSSLSDKARNDGLIKIFTNLQGLTYKL